MKHRSGWDVSVRMSGCQDVNMDVQRIKHDKTFGWKKGERLIVWLHFPWSSIWG